MFTALSSVGGSRQKQTVRMAGAILGGVVLGMGAQVFILPGIDSIVGFTVVFGAVSLAGAWLMTCSPRLSYLGLQTALAFYLIHLQGFRLETSLAVARGRVAGVLLGLFAMWLVFDHLWSSAARILMKRSFVRSLRLLAQLSREPSQTLALRETIHSTLDQTRSYSDGVLFEFGQRRVAALQLRERLRRLQPDLRSLFVLWISATQYRLGLPGFQVSSEALHEQTRFDECSAGVLDALAEAVEKGVPRTVTPRVCLAGCRPEIFDPAHLAVLRDIDKTIGSLVAEVGERVIEVAARIE